MREIFRSNNAIQLSFIESNLRDVGIEPIQLDQHTSSMEGSISAIERRIVVSEEDYDAAMRIMDDLEDKL
ncbi:MAG: DUF2007 domain-containing protein [Pseudomonadota bacterium]